SQPSVSIASLISFEIGRAAISTSGKLSRSAGGGSASNRFRRFAFCCVTRSVGNGNASSEWLTSLKLISLVGQIARPSRFFLAFGRLIVPGSRRIRSIFWVPALALSCTAFLYV